MSEDTIVWPAADSSAYTSTLHYAPEGGLETVDTGIVGGESIMLARDPAGLSEELRDKFPHLADMPVLKISSKNLSLVPDIVKGQVAVSAVDSEGLSVDATGLQIPGVLDDLYFYPGDLGIVWDGDIPTLQVWAPTAKSVKLHVFDDADPETRGTVIDMTGDPQTGMWRIAGDASWVGKYYAQRGDARVLPRIQPRPVPR